MRAARTAWTVSGISTSPMPGRARQASASRTSRPSSMSWRRISSTKNGFPSARATMRARRAIRKVGNRQQAVHQLAGGRLGQRIERPRSEKLRRPPPHPALRSVSSGRDGTEEEDAALDPVG